MPRRSWPADFAHEQLPTPINPRRWGAAALDVTGKQTFDGKRGAAKFAPAKPRNLPELSCPAQWVLADAERSDKHHGQQKSGTDQASYRNGDDAVHF
jgi:hypothetical protein